MAEVTFTPKVLLSFLHAAGLYSSRAWSESCQQQQSADRLHQGSRSTLPDPRHGGSSTSSIGSLQQKSSSSLGSSGQRATSPQQRNTSPQRGGNISPSDRVSALGVPDHRVQQHGTLSVYSTQKKGGYEKKSSGGNSPSRMDRLKQASSSYSNLLMQAGSDVASQLKDVFHTKNNHATLPLEAEDKEAGLETLKALASDPILLSKLECLLWPDKAAGLGFWDPQNERAYTTWELAVLIQENAHSAWGWTYLLKALDRRCKEFPFPPQKLRSFELMADVTPTPFLLDVNKVTNAKAFYVHFAASEADYCQSLQQLCDVPSFSLAGLPQRDR